jgi:hypothetical protein
VAILVAAILGTTLGIRRAIEIRWEGMVGQVGLYREASRVKRPPCWGEAEPGDAWGSYGPAMEEAWRSRSFVGHLESLLRNLEDGVGYDLEDARARLEVHRVSLDRLREGARRPAVVSPSESPGLYPSARHLGQLALLEALACRREGRPDEAWSALRMALKFAWDLSWTPDVAQLDDAGLELLDGSLAALATLLESGALDAADALDAAGVLGAIDRTFPPMRPAHMAILAGAAAVLRGLEPMEGCGSGGEWYVRAPGWRHLWSRSLRLSAGFDELASFVERLADADQLSWTQARALDEEVRQEVRRTKGAFTPEELEGGVGLEADIRRREHRLRLRLVRMAAHYHATGTVLAVEDPGERWMEVVPGDDGVRFGSTIRVWSAGVERGQLHPIVVRIRR